ncbi:MAG: hypothetical protein LBQ15_09375 [Clostridium sp.]|jgi:hypothetical protein|nr:hypothetical protein [Clostridium sp.]
MRLKPQYRPSLYLSESINRKKLGKIKRELASRPFRARVYLLATARSGSDQLEIYSSRLLEQDCCRSSPPYIVGIAKTREEAIGLVERIVGDCLKARGDCAVREYL